jgi:hypothetical protein
MIELQSRHRKDDDDDGENGECVENSVSHDNNPQPEENNKVGTFSESKFDPPPKKLRFYHIFLLG